ncbi:NUDIX hydrolase [Clostridium estertheticum]|uniref:hypothetical protein n=1 Tax=Clostridium estertheticum TaxID=238834 RepID=UPI001CF2010F|nr:hypothetical protein [Clostridium estertheticum]MCB2339122.1 hypothetical protein [Clostridium estertheticum]
MDRPFTISVFIVYKDKVLLHLHKKAKKILLLGGMKNIAVTRSNRKAMIIIDMELILIRKFKTINLD